MAKPRTTPMMAQYLDIKARYPDALLFYRMGDFYELFFDDAVAASAALDIALTKRGKHEGKDIAMCGVPHHAAEGYLLTLIRKGFRVAVCEQMESPVDAKKRGYKAVVKRDVVRLVTAGTLTEDSLLEARAHNYLVSLAELRENFGVAWVDVSTGAFRVSSVPQVMLAPLLARLAPSELLVSQNISDTLRQNLEESEQKPTFIAPSSFDSEAAKLRLGKLYNVASLKGFGQFSRAELAAMGAVVDYLELTQCGKMPLLNAPMQESPGSRMQIDAATRRNLELVRALSGGRDGALLSVIDKTLTGGGARLLENRLTSPSNDLASITTRLDMVEGFVENQPACHEIRTHLAQVPDIERCLSRLSLDRAGPRDLASIRNALAHATDISSHFTHADLPEGALNALGLMQGHEKLVHLLTNSLVAEPPLLARDGGFIAPEFDRELDLARKLRDEGRSVIASKQAEYLGVTNINALKIKHNNVLGYFIETPATHAEKMLSPPFSDMFIHRQTIANAVRFTTVELSKLETRILNAGSRALEIEKRIFGELSHEILAEAAQISGVARALAEIDVATAMAVLAEQENWTRPKIDTSRAFHIEAARHPVVEAALRRSGKPFIANSCDLSTDKKPVWLLTGPNMAGKSTFLRQNAIIAILAQMGAYVPAASAHIGLVNQLFSRVGAADDLARGQSTFMVEMVETAAILNRADAQSLVILDEIGRGTATYDGLSIAWATLEHLHDANRCRALFATHYHELTALSETLSGLHNATVAVKEWKGDVIFLHEVVAGAADRSYGVQVAKLAGLPKPVIARARAVLDMLEKREREGNGTALIDDLPLFGAAHPEPEPESEVETLLADVNPDTLSPREALALVYELKSKL